MKTRDLFLLAAVAFVLYLLSQRRSSSGAGAGSGVQVDPWAQRIDSSVDALGKLWDWGSSLFGGSSDDPTIFHQNPNALADPTMGSGSVSLDE